LAKDEERYIQPTLLAAKPLIDHWTVVDTGSTDRTREIVQDTMADLPGELIERPWVNWGANWTEAVALAAPHTDWVLRLDADWKVSTVPGTRDWLNADPDPECAAWKVPIWDSGMTWLLPLILRSSVPWEYRGACHEYLVGPGKQRQMLGLEIAHMRPGGHEPERFHEYIRLLADDAAAGEPRAVFYTAESYRFLGEKDEAIRWYRARENIREGFDEERWMAAYQAAKLEEDVERLLYVWRQRPHRHEPLSAASRILASQGSGGDVLFLEECRC
jgi:hypothetical protein